MLIPSINIKRVWELMELEKIRPLTDEEFNSAISQKEVPDEDVQAFAERLSNDQGRNLVADK
jgi:molybdate-binding protein